MPSCYAEPRTIDEGAPYRLFASAFGYGFEKQLIRYPLTNQDILLNLVQ